MTLGALSIAFVLAVLLHNSEEALFLPAWLLRQTRWHRPVGRGEFRFAVATLSVLLVVVAGLAFVQGPESPGSYLFFGFVFAMAANAVVPHLAATIALHRYMPGTATGLLLNLPIGVYLLHDAFGRGWISAPSFFWVAPTVAITLVVSIPLLLATGRMLSGIAAR